MSERREIPSRRAACVWFWLQASSAATIAVRSICWSCAGTWPSSWNGVAVSRPEPPAEAARAWTASGSAPRSMSPTGVKTTARSSRTSLLVGALVGLLVGGVAALAAEPFVARRRASAV